MLTLDLVRHGNTFDKTHPDPAQREPVWCGARTDLPLVPYGILQSVAIGQALQAAGVTYDIIYAGPLKRTQQTAQIIAHLTGYSLDRIVTTADLLEMDFGAWEGVSDKQTKEAQPAAYADWNERRIVPDGAGFTPREEMLARLRRAYDGAIRSGAQRALCVTSNGLLSYFAAIVGEDRYEQLREAKALKVATGNLCQLQAEPPAPPAITIWNKSPAELRGLKL